MAAYGLADETWALVDDLFDPPVRRGPRATVPRRQVIEAILWLARTGAQWRELPDRYGSWSAVWATRAAGGIRVCGMRRCGGATLPSAKPKAGTRSRAS